MRLNYACGKQTWPGFFCIDAVKHKQATRDPDLLHTMKFDVERLVNPVPLNDECADELHSYHFLEHVLRYEAPAVLKEFRRLLKPGGLLVLELPNIESACRNLLAGMDDQMCIWPLFGNWTELDPFMTHRFAYSPKTVTALLKECGFKRIEMKPPQTHGARVNRDMRVECVK